MTQFQIVCAAHPNLAIQAGADVGQGITLQECDSTEKAQLWEIALQQAKDGCTDWPLLIAWMGSPAPSPRTGATRPW